jgi:Putative beta-barrel porin-2, OmpL-like. bbp2
MLRKIFVIAIAMASAQYSFAQEAVAPAEEKKSKTTLSGFVDVYYRYDLSQNPANNRTSFTNSHNSFELGMASFRLEHSIGKVSMVADMGFGQRAKEFSYNETGITAAVKQLYISYAATDWLKLTAGSWATHLGYELVDEWANRNYSMSYMFTFGPFFHTGVKADATFGKHGFMLGIANPTDYKSAPLNSKKSVLAQYSLAVTDNWKVYLNYVGGTRPADSSKVNQFDAVVTGKLSEKFSIGYNGTIFKIKSPALGRSLKDETQDWWASAVYLNLDPVSNFGLTLRSEFFNDQSQLAPTSFATQGANIWANTLSANIKIYGLTIIPEIRIEQASKDVFYDKESNPKGANTSLLVAAIYKW